MCYLEHRQFSEGERERERWLDGGKKDGDRGREKEEGRKPDRGEKKIERKRGREREREREREKDRQIERKRKGYSSGIYNEIHSITMNEIFSFVSVSVVMCLCVRVCALSFLKSVLFPQ